MKKEYILFIAFLLIGTVAAQAQIKLGVKGGVNFSQINSSDVAFKGENIIAWHAGLMAEYKMRSFGVEVDAIYTQNGARLDLGGAAEDLINTYIAIPVLAKYYFLGFLNVHAGPQFSFLTSSKLGDLDYKDQLASNDLQVVFGAGLDLARIHASVRYNLGVKDINLNTAQSYDLKNNVIMISIGIWLR